MGTNQQGKDLYRDTFVRYLGYANEVGEAFRQLVHVYVVRGSYVVASGYCVADTIDKSYRKYKLPFELETDRIKSSATEAIDCLTWQALASVIIPGFTINRICALSMYLLHRRYRMKSSMAKWATVFVGLGSIPFIVKPIDHSVDYMMDRTLRPWLRS